MRSEHGFTLVEMAIATMIGLLFLGLAGTFLMSTLGAGNFTQGQGFTLNDARNAMQQMEKELRGADFINWCTPAGSCLEVGAQKVTGGFRTVRYTHDGDTDALERAELDEGTGTWGDDRLILDRVVNTSSQPVFDCDAVSTLLRVTIDLRIEPTPASNPNLHLHTSVRPRNFPSKQVCP